MIKAPIPNNEKSRLKAVKSLNILDTKPEERFDNITREAARLFEVPISTVSIIDENREWYKSCYGLNVKEGKREISFCGHALLETNILVVGDTLLDERFKDNPLVTGEPHIRFYAGVVLRDKETKLPVGVFCIKDTKPRELNTTQTAQLIALAELAEEEINKKPVS